ncbi:MAG: hypothetical protein AAF572_10435 [Cyanobacteria bacterium P01_B01_bin.77]
MQSISNNEEKQSKHSLQKGIERRQDNLSAASSTLSRISRRMTNFSRIGTILTVVLGAFIATGELAEQHFSKGAEREFAVTFIRLWV